MKPLKPLTTHLNQKYEHLGGAAPFLAIVESDDRRDTKLIAIHNQYHITLNAAAKWIGRYEKEGSRV